MAAAAASNTQLTVLITGASRGIGLGLVETYAKKGWRVVAAARNPAKATDLQALAKAHAKAVSVVALDVSDSKSIAALPALLNGGSDHKVSALDLLVNNAGVADHFSTLDKSTVATWLEVYRTNVVGVWELTHALLPLLRKSPAPKVANISSILGSVAITNDGDWPGLGVAHRASKAALNELGAVQAREYNLATVTALSGTDAAAKTAAPPLLTVLAVHPGWVDTDMGNAGGAKPPTSIADSVAGVEHAISAAKVNAKQVFVDFQNKPLPW